MTDGFCSFSSMSSGIFFKLSSVKLSNLLTACGKQGKLETWIPCKMQCFYEKVIVQCRVFVQYNHANSNLAIYYHETSQDKLPRA